MNTTSSRRVRLAVLCSSAGGVLDALCRIQNRGVWPFELVGVVTDRECAAERVATDNGVPCQRVVPKDAKTWSNQVANVLTNWQPDAVLLLILRKVGREIWNNPSFSTWNVHPSLLPAFPGLNALERNFSEAQHAAARQQGRSVPLGATIHIVNDVIDGGPIISQMSFTIADAPTLEQAQHLCYLLKVGLVLQCVCKFIEGSLPSLSGKTRECQSQSQWWKPYEPIAGVLAALAQHWAVDWLQQKPEFCAAPAAMECVRA